VEVSFIGEGNRSTQGQQHLHMVYIYLNRYDITEFVQQHLHMMYIYLNRYDITEFVQQHLHMMYIYLNR
jgi:hypothetical protein